MTLCLAATLALIHGTRAESPRAFGLAGLLLGLASLTRSEAVLLLALLVVPLAFLHSPRRRVACTAFAVLAFAVAVMPWTARNALRFDAFIPISQSLKGVLVGANCESSYYGDGIGSWNPFCVVSLDTINNVSCTT